MAYSDVILADSPRAYYRLEEASGNPQDSSGNAMHCTANNGTPAYQQAGAASIGGFSILLHSATSDRFSAPDNALLDLADVFTVEAWIKRASTGAAQGIVSKGTGAYYLRIDSTDHLDLLKSQTADIVQSTTTITDTTTWHHVVATKTGSTVKLYVDNVDVTGTVANATCVDNAIGLAIGEDSGAGEPYNGSLDEVAIYSTALTAARVTAHYNAGQGIVVGGGPPARPIMAWP